MERQKLGEGKKPRLQAKRYIAMPRGKEMENDGCEGFQSRIQLTQTTTGQSLPPHASKLQQDWNGGKCKRLSAKV